ncbi:CPBP family intramembrane metalloprotease [Brachybacterium sp. JB7]|uniref:CPBP family intramembrane metalloprotease domain-containing protein n=1 Tax=Brachybacterium alimentarium TaxID=47845 RepID=A0A2A3YNP2_9MICO|nr:MULTISPECIES: CPBP family intramembrane glutamic endopeptidase [Brachybacterium]PCC33022.1 CPBP family intramembrane metalloprotease domain-containing protein [Brachybacterium alimentarium]PCC40894.1 CPBP family intramembrane metalloprotease domain-containing protein [Brachybacterium alimentarium]RCS61048.1 CPBP family intramembrane metalloprotease [Brachybacterium sp. JB7]
MQTLTENRTWLRVEVIVVLALSLGRSAVYSLIALVQALAAGPLSGQSTSLNSSLQENPWLDLLQQLLSIVFTLTPVALVVLLLALSAGTFAQALRDLGVDLGRPGKDLAWGLALTAGIGLPGLAVYYAGRALGATVEVIPAALDTHWWTVPVLVLHAVKNAVLEEVIVVGYLYQRLERLGWSGRRIIIASALLRGAYHTYQGVGPGLANLAMGLVFGEFYRRSRRTMPLIVAHTLIDVFAFVGYALLKSLIAT